MSRFEFALLFVVAAITAGQNASRTVAAMVHSAIYGADEQVWIYTPPDYDAHKPGGYPLLIAFDGEDYRSDTTMNLPAILDSLFAARAAPRFVAVMIANGRVAARKDELGNSSRYVRFLGSELLPWIRQRWNVTHDPHGTVITGYSAGGLAAVFAAIERPDLFGNVLAQSPAVWRGPNGANGAPYEYVRRRVRSLPRRDVRFLIDVGERETRAVNGTGPVFIGAVRRLRAALRDKGSPVIYTEIPGGIHDFSTWRPRFAADLVALLHAR